MHRAVLMLQMGRRWTAVPPWPGRQTICCALFRGHRLLAPQDCAPLPLQPAPRIYKLCQVIDASTAVNRLNMAADAKARDPLSLCLRLPMPLSHRCRAENMSAPAAKLAAAAASQVNLPALSPYASHAREFKSD